MRKFRIALFVALAPTAAVAGQWGGQWGGMLWGPEVTEIPTVHPWGAALLVVGLALAAWLLLRRETN